MNEATRWGLKVDLVDIDRSRCGAGGGQARRDEARLDRDAVQSALVDHRHRRGGARSRMRPARCSRSIRPPRRRADAAARARRRYRHACRDQISQRPFRCGRGRARDGAQPMRSGSASGATARMLGQILGPFEAFLLMRGMRTLHLRVRGGLRDRRWSSPSAWREHAARRRGALSGPPRPSRPRRRRGGR